MKFRKSHILISFVVIILLGCSQQQKLLKTADNDTKYAAAMDYYDKHDYYRALQIFQQLINFYQGTEQAQKLQFRYAYCYYYQEDYVLASYYFKRFSENFPRSEYTEESTYMNAYCYFLDSPNSSLDQANTFQAINELQLFKDLYPKSTRIAKCDTLIGQLHLKLQKKEFSIASLYMKMEQYEAAITAFTSLLEDYPDTPYKEDILFSILKSYYNYAQKSITTKQQERYQAAIDAFNELVFQFPETKYMRDAKYIRDNVMKKVENNQTSLN